MNPERLTQAVHRVAIGFGILCFDINLGRFNILPNWLGYWLILKVLDDIALEEPSAALLKPLGKLLMLWFVGVWFLQIFGVTVKGSFMVYIVAVEQIYFQFQLLTNLAGIAGKYAPRFAYRILQLRTAMTLIVTGYTLLSAFVVSEAVTVMTAVVQIAVAFWLLRTLLNMENTMAERFGLNEERPMSFAERIQQDADYEKTAEG